MKPRVPKLAWDFIDKAEGDVLKAYWDNGGWACGRGIHAPDINQNTVWTEETSNERFGQELQKVADDLCPKIKPELSDPALTACLSIRYNIGEEIDDSTLIQDINSGNIRGAADEFPKWCHEKKNGIEVVNGNLLARRKKERTLFLSGCPAVPEVRPNTPQTEPVGPAPVPVRVPVGVKAMKKWIPAIVGILGVISGLVDPLVAKGVAHWVADNPQWGTVIAGLVGAIYHGLPSPVQVKK